MRAQIRADVRGGAVGAPGPAQPDRVRFHAQGGRELAAQVDPENARFQEYGSTGSGANASARSSYQLSASQAASYTVATVLAGWTPSYNQ